MAHCIRVCCFLLLVLFLSSTSAPAATIYAVAGDETGAGPSTLYSIDPDTQTINVLEQFDPVASGLGVMATVGKSANPNELLIGFVTSPTTSRLRSYSLSSGVFSDISIDEPAPIIGFGGTYFAAGGGGYGYPGLTTEVYEVDPMTGVSTLVGTAPFSITGDLAEDPTTGVLYAATDNGLATVNPSDATMALVGPLLDGMFGLAFSEDGRLWALSASSVLYEIDPSDGSGTFVMNGLAGSFDLASEVVPEPSTGVLLGLGLAALATRTRIKTVAAGAAEV